MTHEEIMARCLELAKNGYGKVSPNPLVGSVIIKDNNIIGEGWHEKYGGPHAEVMAVNSVKDQRLLKGASIYVSLEPCSHFGKTPPCSDLIIDKAFSKVFIAMKDPNPLVAGRGIKKLKDNGIEVISGILEREAQWLNRFFVKHILSKRPYIILKSAQSLDGFISSQGKRTQISGPESMEDVHRTRSMVDAIMVGYNTVRIDDPKLNVRLVDGIDPFKIVLDKELNIDLNSNLVRMAPEKLILIHCSENEKRIQELSRLKIELIKVDLIENSLDLDKAFSILGSRFNSILVEGGQKLNSYLVKNQLIDEIQIYKSNHFLFEGLKAFQSIDLAVDLKFKELELLGQDLKFTFAK